MKRRNFEKQGQTLRIEEQGINNQGHNEGKRGREAMTRNIADWNKRETTNEERDSILHAVEPKFLRRARK